MARRAIRRVPGFRTGRWWKAAIAICGYVFLGLMAVAGMTTMFPTVTALALGGLAVVLLAFGAGGVRQRTPGLNSRNPLIAAGSWIAVLGLIVAASIAADSVLLSPETRTARDAMYARIAVENARLAAERAAREAAARAAASTPAPTAAPTAAPSPTATPSPAATPSPTAAPTATPTPTATPSPTRNSSLALSLSATTVSTDTGVRGTATLQDVTPAAGGTMKYAVYNDSGCSSGPAVDAGTKPVANGSVAPSDAVSFENFGAAYWRAAYSGDGENPQLVSDCVRVTVTLPPPVAYQVQERKDVSFAGRRRTAVNVLIPGDPTKGQKIATLAAIARAELRAADVVYVRAWRSAADQAFSSCQTITVGAAELSADGRGWAAGQSVGGDTSGFGPDNGQIQGRVELPPLDRAGCPTKNEQFTVAR